MLKTLKSGETHAGRQAARVALLASCLFALLATLPGGAGAVVLEGSVNDLTGQPVGGAIVTLKTGGLNATTISTYTASNGRFAFPDTGHGKIAATDLSMQKVGYLPSGMSTIKTQGQRQIASIRAKRIDNVAAQVPPSAWRGVILPVLRLPAMPSCSTVRSATSSRLPRHATTSLSFPCCRTSSAKKSGTT